MTTMENTTHGPNSVETFVTSPSQAEKNYNHYDPTRERVPHKVEGEDDAYNNSSTDSSDEYDTDLEVEITGKPSSKTGGETDPDVICRDVYGRWCDKYPSRHKPFPQSHISKSLSEKTLHIKHRSIGGPAMFPISAALTNNFRVQKLDLDGADIKEEGVIYLVKALVDNVTVSHLNLSNNNLEHEGTQWVAYLLTKNNFLKHVNLSGNKIQDRSAYHIATVLEVNKSLDHLDLSHNQLGEQGIKLIAAALAYNSCLKTFRLNWNHIRRQGAVALSQSLKFNDCLRLLDVSWNGFGYEGSLALSKSLKENKTLRELNLSNNRISWHGALLLSRGLKLNVGLHILRIGHNPLTTTGCHDIVNAIAAGSSQIKTLDLEGVPIVAETEILSSFVRLKRDFLLLHGGIVYLPDILGERRERKKDHMEVVMEYIKATLTRPLEMLKNFDKTTSLVISQDEFVARLVKADVPLHKFEMRILANAVADKGRQSKPGSVDYKMLVQTVTEQILRNRARHYCEEAQKRKLREYHKQILDSGLNENVGTSRCNLFASPAEAAQSPALGREVSSLSLSMVRVTPDMIAARSNHSCLSESKFLKPLSHKDKGAEISMSTPLHQVGLKKKKKKKRVGKTRKTSKKRSVESPLKTCVSELDRQTSNIL